MTNIYFVYGTLKRGFRAHHLLANAQFLGEVKTHPRYHLYDMGGFPGMIVESDGGGVSGELFEVTDQRIVKNLDRYEAVATGLFRREEIELVDGRWAQAYLFNMDHDGCTEIEEGVWHGEEED